MSYAPDRNCLLSMTILYHLKLYTFVPCEFECGKLVMRRITENCKGFVYLISLKPLLSFIVNKFSCLLCFVVFFLFSSQGHVHHLDFSAVPRCVVCSGVGCGRHRKKTTRSDLNNIIFIRKSMFMLLLACL